MDKKIKIMGVITTPIELLVAIIENFLYGFVGNSITVFINKNWDVAVLINFIIYYSFLSHIVNRNKYETILGKFIIFPVAATLGAFTGYKIALLIVNYIQ